MIDIISFLGLLSVIMIFVNIGQSNKFNIYLGVFFFSMAAFIIGNKIISMTTNYYVISFTIPILAGVLMSTGPMLYFYTVSILNKHKRNGFYYLHYLPILLVLIDLLPFLLKSREYKEEFYKMIQLSILNFFLINIISSLLIIDKNIYKYILTIFQKSGTVFIKEGIEMELDSKSSYIYTILTKIFVIIYLIFSIIIC